MRNPDSKLSRLRHLVQQKRILHARDLTPLGIPQRYLGYLCDEGVLVKSGRGVYMVPGGPEDVHLGLAQVAKAIPGGIICLLSALRFHEIGTQIPHQVWVALNPRAARPHVMQGQIRIFRFSGPALAEGIGEHVIAGVQVRIYSPAKTVADCFKFRNKIGLDVALEALRESVHGHKCSVDELWQYANICRVANIMRPYMEAVL